MKKVVVNESTCPKCGNAMVIDKKNKYDFCNICGEMVNNANYKSTKLAVISIGFAILSVILYIVTRSLRY